MRMRDSGLERECVCSYLRKGEVFVRSKDVGVWMREEGVSYLGQDGTKEGGVVLAGDLLGVYVCMYVCMYVCELSIPTRDTDRDRK